MALKKGRLGSIPDAIQYDDAEFTTSIEVDHPIRVNSAPSNANDVLRLGDVSPTSLFETGDVCLSIRSSKTGWVRMNDGTIGDASSGASTRANADCEDLFLLLWTNVSDSYAPVTGGRGVSASADWAAHKKIKLLTSLGRAILNTGNGSGLTNRALGEYGGEETHTLTEAELATHDHGAWTLGGGAHYHNANDDDAFVTFRSVNPAYEVGTANVNAGYRTHTETDGAHNHDISVGNAGSGNAHNNMQPWVALNLFMKL